MTDPFAEALEDEMSRLRPPTASGGDSVASADAVRQTLTGKHVCPYCGHQHPGGAEPCPRCTMEDTPATRQATKARLGPWYVLQSRNPSAPGMRYMTLLALINKGQVTPRSILRGPTTSQLWRYAAHVRGVSREFGVCYSCGGDVERLSTLCGHCQRSQEPPAEPDALLENRPAVQPAAVDAVENTYANRMRELNRQRERGATEAQPNHKAARNDLARRGDGRVVSAMELAAALQDDAADSSERPRWRVAKTFATLLLLAAAVGAGVLYFMPQYRAPVFTWANQTWNDARTKVASIEWPHFSSGGATEPAPQVKQVNRVSHDPPAPVDPVAVDPVPTRVPPVTKPEAEKPIVKAPEPPPAVVEAPKPAPDPAAALDQARKLWRDAIDAEARGDVNGAINLYEQIKKLPSDVWPGGLQINLDLARKRLESSSAR